VEDQKFINFFLNSDKKLKKSQPQKKFDSLGGVIYYKLRFWKN